MRRREFIVGLSGAAARPLHAWAQQRDPIKRLGVLVGGAEGLATVPRVLPGALAKLGWIEGRNLRLDVRFGAGDPDLYRAYAAELVSLKPDVIVTGGEAATKAVQRQTQAIPIVFNFVGDPLAAGIVKSVARPEGNATGITNGFSSLGGKCLQWLKEAVPRIERVADLYNRNALEFERAIEAFAAEPNGGVIVQGGVSNIYAPPLLYALMIKLRLPAISVSSTDAADGSLVSYAANLDELNRRTASHIDRILRGAKPSDLPVEYPTRFDLVLNLKTAKAIGITFPPTLIALADEVIE